MKEIFRRIYYFIIKMLPDKLVINIENFRTYKRFLNKQKPEYFGEKIQWLKLYGNLEKYNDYVDKYKVREFVKNTIGEKYLIPLLGVYDKIEEIDYGILPNQFVLKLNHGSGYNIIVKEKNKENITNINKKLNKWIKEDYYKIKKEYQYKNVIKKIVCEEYINDSKGELLDYKFFCFDGEPEFVKVDFDRFQNHKANFYDNNWKLLNLQETGFENNKNEVDKPKKFNEMLEIARKLSSEFKFVRVDLYNVDEKIYFGELTFTPASGKNSFTPLEKDKEIAERINL